VFRELHDRRVEHTFFWLEARLQIFQEAMRVARSERGGNVIFSGRTLFVGCPLGARPVSSVRFVVASNFAFLVAVFDPTGFSPSESASVFRLLELAARFGGIDKSVTWVMQELNEERRGLERAITKTELRKRDIARRDDKQAREVH
jgi:hypothetical protein